MPTLSFPAAFLPVLVLAASARADLFLHEPFNYPEGSLTGRSGALGTTGEWTSYESLHPADGWRIHTEGTTTGIVVDPGPPVGRNMFDGKVANLPTTGGFTGLPGPDDVGEPDPDRDFEIGRYMDASIALAPSVTATFRTKSTTWFSYVTAHGWDRNQETAALTLATDPTPASSRSLTLTNGGHGIGSGGGPPRNNRLHILPRFYQDGVAWNALGPVTAWSQDSMTVPFATGAMSWAATDARGFGTPNIVVGRIQWDSDTNGEDVITVAAFRDTDTLTEEAFLNLIALKPDLSSATWLAAKPNIDQSQLDTLNLSGTKFFIDEIRIGSSFSDIIGASAPTTPFAIVSHSFNPATRVLTLTWTSEPGASYSVRYTRNPADWSRELDDNVPASSGPTTTKSYQLSDFGLGSEPSLFFRIHRR